MIQDITKHFFLLAIASLLCIIFMKHVSLALGYLFTWHSILSKDLAMIYSGGHWGMMIRGVLAMALIPGAIAGVIGGTYWLVKREQMPYLFNVFWLTWLVLLTGIALK